MRRQLNSTVHRRMNVLLLLDDGWAAERIAEAPYIDAESFAWFSVVIPGPPPPARPFLCANADTGLEGPRIGTWAKAMQTSACDLDHRRIVESRIVLMLSQKLRR